MLLSWLRHHSRVFLFLSHSITVTEWPHLMWVFYALGYTKQGMLRPRCSYWACQWLTAVRDAFLLSFPHRRGALCLLTAILWEAKCMGSDSAVFQGQPFGASTASTASLPAVAKASYTQREKLQGILMCSMAWEDGQVKLLHTQFQRCCLVFRRVWEKLLDFAEIILLRLLWKKYCIRENRNSFSAMSGIIFLWCRSWSVQWRIRKALWTS